MSALREVQGKPGQQRAAHLAGSEGTPETARSTASGSDDGDGRPSYLARLSSLVQSTRRALALVWGTHRGLSLLLASMTLIVGLMPGAIASLARHIVDAVAATQAHDTASRAVALRCVLLEALAVLAMTAAQRTLGVAESLLRALLGHRVNVLIMEKCLSLSLPHFEDSEVYDRLNDVRRQATTRPLSLVMRTLGVVQNLVSLVTCAFLLLAFSPWAVLVLLLAGVPGFVAEVRYSGVAFRLFRWQSPETRRQHYIETVLAREDYAKEVMLFGLGPLLLGRYRSTFGRLYAEDRNLVLRRGAAAWALGLCGTLALYAAYLWNVLAALDGRITLGQMTMYLMLFRQGQGAVTACLGAVGGIYDDNLYLSQLYAFLDEPAREGRLAEGHPVSDSAVTGTAREGVTAGAVPGDGVRFEAVGFSYPGATAPALHPFSLHLPPGARLALVGENGSGKTTLVKLLTRLYQPTSGRVLLDGTDLAHWDEAALRRRIGVIFQDFARYQLLLGENVGVGDVQRFEDEAAWRQAVEQAQASEMVERLPQGYQTQLGRWFKGGQELSGGQWQKLALARAFMRTEADIVVLDEPTAAIDARAEALIFERFRELTRGQTAILISHRFSTVRMAEKIVVLHQGQVIEAGSHAELLERGGRYAQLFELQAAGYH